MKVGWSMCIYWLNYSRKLRRKEGGGNSESPSPGPIGPGVEITNHRGSSILFPVSNRQSCNMIFLH